MLLRPNARLAVGTALLSWLAPAAAQTIGAGTIDNATDTPAQGAHIPVAASQERKLDIDVGGTVTYDSNVARSSKAVAAQNGLKQSDAYFSPVVTTDISLPFGNNVAYLTGIASYSFYDRNSRLNGERLALDGGVSHQFNRCNLAFDGEIDRARSVIVDLIAQGAGVRNFETTGTAGLTAKCGGTVGLQPFAEFNYSSGTNSNERRRGSDYRTLTYGGGLGYAQPSIGTIGVIASIQDTDYTARDGSVGTILSGIQSFPTRSIGLYYVRDVTQFFTGKLRINYTDVNSSDGKDFRGVTGEASVRVTPTQHFGIEASVYRMVDPSLSFNADFEVETGSKFNIDANFTPRLGATVGYSYLHRQYRGASLNLVHLLTKDDDHLLNGQLNYRLNRRMRLTLATTYEIRRANSSYYDFDSFRALAGVSATF